MPILRFKNEQTFKKYIYSRTKKTSRSISQTKISIKISLILLLKRKPAYAIDFGLRLFKEQQPISQCGSFFFISN